MMLAERMIQFISPWIIIVVTVIQFSCDSYTIPKDQEIPDQEEGFPPFITPAEEYFILNISGDHKIDGDTYRLKISGAVDNPAEFSLEELMNREMMEKTLTIECIENRNNGRLIGTATWKGFNLYDLLKDLGIKEEVQFVKYICSDGYFTYNTLDELRNKEVIAALYMNGEPIPENLGFPLRVIFPGYYGVRQPGWVVEIQLLDRGVRDFWGETQFEKWETDSSIAIDSKIFYPPNKDTVVIGEPFKVGGAAYGSRRIASVEITLDDGATWIPTYVKQSMDEDYVWIFWEASLTPQASGNLNIKARATGQDGQVQPRTDYQNLDGTNSWPWVNVYVREAE